METPIERSALRLYIIPVVEKDQKSIIAFEASISEQFCFAVLASDLTKRHQRKKDLNQRQNES